MEVAKKRGDCIPHMFPISICRIKYILHTEFILHLATTSSTQPIRTQTRDFVSDLRFSNHSFVLYVSRHSHIQPTVSYTNANLLTNQPTTTLDCHSCCIMVSHAPHRTHSTQSDPHIDTSVHNISHPNQTTREPTFISFPTRQCLAACLLCLPVRLVVGEGLCCMSICLFVSLSLLSVFPLYFLLLIPKKSDN